MKNEKNKTAENRFAKILKTVIIITLILGIICGAVGASLNFAVMSVSDRILSYEDIKNLKDIDCIVVLGCKVKDGGVPSAMLYDRLKVGAEIYSLGIADKILMSGDSRRENYDEVGTMRRVSEELGVPSENIISDGYGLSTYDSIYRLKGVYGYDKIVIITQEYHLYRAIYIAKELGIDAYGVSADIRKYRGQWKRDVREVLARIKDFCYCKSGADAEMGVSVWNEEE